MLARVIVTTTLVAGAVVAVALHAARPDLLAELTREDGIVEYGKALLLLGASVGFGIVLARVRFRNLWYLGYTALFLVLAGEEISWGQRLLGIDTPEGFARINEQGETSLHNVTGVHGSIRAVGLLVILVICFAIPALHRWSPPARR